MYSLHIRYWSKNFILFPLYVENKSSLKIYHYDILFKFFIQSTLSLLDQWHIPLYDTLNVYIINHPTTHCPIGRSILSAPKVDLTPQYAAKGLVYYLLFLHTIFFHCISISISGHAWRNAGWFVHVPGVCVQGHDPAPAQDQWGRVRLAQEGALEHHVGAPWHLVRGLWPPHS